MELIWEGQKQHHKVNVVLEICVCVGWWQDVSHVTVSLEEGGEVMEEELERRRRRTGVVFSVRLWW